MSKEPTPDLEEAGRRLIEAVNRRDFEAVAALYAPDAVWDVSLLGLEGVFEGREEIRRAYEDLVAPYEEFWLVQQEFHGMGNGVRLNVTLARGRLRGSGGSVELRTGVVAIWANGLIERVTTYTDIDEARAAAERLAKERG